jgi:hypothetical protein
MVGSPYFDHPLTRPLSVFRDKGLFFTKNKLFENVVLDFLAVFLYSIQESGGDFWLSREASILKRPVEVVQIVS